MSPHLIAARATALFLGVLCVVAARADDRHAPAVPAAQAVPLAAQARLPGPNSRPVDLVAALGQAWGEPALRDLLTAFRIKGKPVAERGDLTTHLQNRALGVELTFRYAEVLDVPLPDARDGTLVLSNIRFYGRGIRTHAPFKGALPFGLRFGDTGRMVMEKVGVPDLIGSINGLLLRWDTQGYALFAQFDEKGGMDRLSLQLPMVVTNRPGLVRR
jgi:hypothetical protein